MGRGFVIPRREQALSLPKRWVGLLRQEARGEPLSPYEWLSLKSFIDFGHRFDLYSFDPHIAVPAQVRVRDAAELAGRAELFVYERGFGKGSPAGFANLFRYILLAERGGWWVDTDVVCLSDVIPDYPQFVARQVDGLVNNAVMRFEPHHPVDRSAGATPVRGC
jgi:hypothetical protein